MNYWLMKSEPSAYSWDDLINQGIGTWDGVRNYAARLNLMAMKVGDLAFFYHSNEGKEIVGIVEVVKEHFPDETDDTGKWVVVQIKPREKLPKAVTLSAIKSDNRLTAMELIRLSRLSVSKVSKEEFDIILEHANNEN
ncbi:MAG: EVE domain-containing protein [Bacteroidota bacterium]